MENNYNGAGQIGVNDLLLARGVGGYGGFGFGGYPSGYGSFAGPAANAVRLNRNEAVTRDSGECTRLTLGAGLDRISDQNEENRRMAEFTSIRDGQTNSEFRNADRLRDIEREIAANARAAAECCCETQKELLKQTAQMEKGFCEAKLEACKNTNEILAAIADNKATILAAESRNVERALNAANAELTALKTQIACGCCDSHHHHR